MILTAENVLTVAEDTIVFVKHPVTNEQVECRVEELGFDDSIFLVTADSRVEEYNRLVEADPFGGYDIRYEDYIKHLRNNDGYAGMTRKEMSEALASGNYTIE